jgi:hypothetical protein
MQINDLSIMLKALCKADGMDASSSVSDTPDQSSGVLSPPNRSEKGSEMSLELDEGISE